MRIRPWWSVYISTGIFLCISYVSRYPTVRQRSKTQLEPPLQCSWHLGMLQSLWEPPLLCSQLTASSLAQSPHSGTGVCSSLSARVQEFHDNCWVIYIYIFKCHPCTDTSIVTAAWPQGENPKRHFAVFLFLSAGLQNTLASSLLKSDFNSTKYRNSTLCRG